MIQENGLKDFSDDYPDYFDRTPLKEESVEDMSNAVLFWFLKTRNITGQTLIVDGECLKFNRPLLIPLVVLSE